jgi:hypothetical protein
MSPKRVMQFGGVVVTASALLLVVRTGHVAVSLGAVPGVGTDVNNQSWIAFWLQLTFMRLFATALAGLGAIFLWSASHLSAEQLRSLLRIATLVLAALGLTAVTQQFAIWNSSSGWVIAGLFVFLATICGMSAARPVFRH